MLNTNKRYSILTENGFKDFEGVKRSKGKLYKLTLENGYSIRLTKNHKLLNHFKEKVPLYKLKIGDLILTDKGSSKIISIEEDKFGFVYDIIKVDNENHSFIANGFVSSNCAFVDNYEEFSDSVLPTISSSTKSQVIATSTPRGLNHWFSMWDDAVKGKSSYVPVKVEWNEVEGRDENFKELMIKTLKGGLTSWMQEYECEFIGSANTLVDMRKLNEIKTAESLSEPFFDENCRVYEEPKENHIYVMVADGSKARIDSFAYHIIDITKIPFRQVVAGEVQISYLLAPNIFYNILRAYNEALLICENNDGGGTSVLDLLFQMFEYENIYQDEGKNYLGTRTTKGNRSKNLSNMKLFIENNKLLLNDMKTKDQLMKFVNKNGKFEAQDSSTHDDYVMALSLLFSPISNNIQNIIDYEGFVKTLQDSNSGDKEDDTYKFVMMGGFDDGTSEAGNKQYYYDENGNIDYF